MGNNGRTIPDEVIRELQDIPIHSVCDALRIPYHGDCPSGDHDSEGHNCFQTNPSKNLWICFHCKDILKKKNYAGVIGLVEITLKYNTPQACRWLAERFRPDLTQSISNMSPDAWKKYQEDKQKKEQIYKALDYAINYYHKKLLQNNEAMKYITDRGVKEEFIKGNDYIKFGYSPYNDMDLYRELIEKFGKEITLWTGLFYINGERVSQSLNDTAVYSYQVGGHARYIIGRSIKEKKFKKLNKRDNPYLKNEIFGRDSLSIKNEKFKDSVLIAEGLFDAILAIQADIPTISPITTSFSQWQIEDLIKLAKRFKTIYIVPDPDQAGEGGAVKTAKQLLKENKTVKIIYLPTIKDVDKADLAEYLKIHSPEDFFKLVDESVALIDFLIQSIPQNTEKTGLNKLFQSKDIIKTIQAMDAITQEHYQEVLSERFNLKIETVEELLKKTSDIDIHEAVEGKPLPPAPVQVESSGAGSQEPGEKKEEYPPLVGFTLRELMEEEFPPIKYLVQDILPEGLTILAGKPKIGKSIFALNISLSIAKGCITLGKFTTEKTDVAYFALEDHKRRLKKRTLPGLNQMIQDHKDIPDNFTFFNSLLPLQKGGFEQLNSYLEAHKEVKFIVIDTIGRVKSPSYKGNSYEVDTQLYSKLHEIYLKKNVSILVITHTKKQEIHQKNTIPKHRTQSRFRPVIRQKRGVHLYKTNIVNFDEWQ